MRHAVIDEDLNRILGAALPWERLAGKTVLISGAAGFLGAYMAETILEANVRFQREPSTLLLLVRDRAVAEARFAHYDGRPELKYLVQDVCDPLSTSVRADVVIHAAGRASPKYYAVDPCGTIAPNVLGANQMLKLASTSGSELFLFFSSSEVYGYLPPDKVPIREDVFGPIDPAEPRSCYAESKRLGEAMCVAWANQKGVPAKIVRPFHIYGPGLRLDDGRVYADFVADVLAGRAITLRSDGRAKRSFCYLADAVRGFFTVLFNGEVATSYNVGDPRGETSIRDLADLLVRTFPEKPLSIQFEPRSPDDPYVPSYVDRSSPDISRIKSLGWEPTTRLYEGFRRTVRSYT
jgi:nucleoside-diphosphate-sugar epimerase